MARDHRVGEVEKHPLPALCCGGRRGAAAGDGAARGCGAVRMLPAKGEENTPKERKGMKTLGTVFSVHNGLSLGGPP